MEEFDAVVIGAGMIGSAAGKYLSKTLRKVAVIGPDQPPREDYSNHDIFGAHYDEARITRNLDADPVWAYLATQSIQRYRDIEKESGLGFFTECGYVWMQNPETPGFQRGVALSKGKASLFTSKPEIQSIFSFFNPSPNVHALFDEKNAGIINPRILVKAQLKLAQKNGCKLIRDSVREMLETSDSSWILFTESGKSIKTKKVLIAPGAFFCSVKINSNHVKDVDLRPKGITVALIKITDAHVLEKLKNMPAASYTPAGEGKFGFYLLPPVKYPDGHFYVKLGSLDHAERSDFEQINHFSNLEDIANFYRYGASKDVALQLARELKQFMPDVDISHVTSDTCVIGETGNARPFIDTIGPNLYFAGGGNGWAAKSSDEIGRLASDLTLENWNCPFPQSTFECLIKKHPSKL